MKIRVEEDSKQTEIEIVIHCCQQNSEILKLVQLLKQGKDILICKKDREIYQINIDDIMYIESIDEKTFVYLQEMIYETQYKLYELEDMLHMRSFVRVSKSCILHLKYLKSVKALFNGKYEATLISDEKLVINRSYMANFKKIMGI